jgi:hypothetical protein
VSFSPFCFGSKRSSSVRAPSLNSFSTQILLLCLLSASEVSLVLLSGAHLGLVLGYCGPLISLPPLFLFWFQILRSVARFCSSVRVNFHLVLCERTGHPALSLHLIPARRRGFPQAQSWSLADLGASFLVFLPPFRPGLGLLLGPCSSNIFVTSRLPFRFRIGPAPATHRSTLC